MCVCVCIGLSEFVENSWGFLFIVDWWIAPCSAPSKIAANRTLFVHYSVVAKWGKGEMGWGVVRQLRHNTQIYTQRHSASMHFSSHQVGLWRMLMMLAYGVCVWSIYVYWANAERSTSCARSCHYNFRRVVNEYILWRWRHTKCMRWWGFVVIFSRYWVLTYFYVRDWF